MVLQLRATSGILAAASALIVILLCQVQGLAGAGAHKEKKSRYYYEKGTCDGKENKHYLCCNHHNLHRDIESYPKESEWCSNQLDKENRCEFLLDIERKIVSQEAQDDLDQEDLLYFLVIFLIIGYGAAVRTVIQLIKSYDLPIPKLPYTVILMISGLGIGIISKEYCLEFQKFTALARTPPQVVLFTFLPVLIFESAFSIPVHVFYRSSGQLLITAFPGMVISTFTTAGVCMLFLKDYQWGFVEALLFGSIISATDPVAVVSILRELGTSETLSVMIEGESLLNDGVAILMYKLFEKMLVCELEGESYLGVTWVIIKDFCVIALGGPLFGWVMARISILCLSHIFNDATVEITITLAAAYLTYFIGDHMLHVSGVMAVVALGLVMGSERTCISPEVEVKVHRFWEMLGYLANTVLFVLVGIIISETALTRITLNDLWYLIFLYIALNIIRLVMLLILMPILQRLGYGLKWENMIIMCWGGLRGAVGLCLAIEVFRGKLCQTHPLIGPKFLFQTAGIVTLTLVINGTTTKFLLDLLKLTQISPGRFQDMAMTTKQLMNANKRALAMLKHDRFLADSNWRIVEKSTVIEDPYMKKSAPVKAGDVPSLLEIHVGHADHLTECPECHHMVRNEATAEEIRSLTEESRMRLLKALKVSHWRQFEEGILTEYSVLILVSVVERTEDQELAMIKAEDIKKYWKLHGVIRLCRRIFLRKEDPNKPPAKQVPPPSSLCLTRFWKIATNQWFNLAVLMIITLNLVPIIWELVRIIMALDRAGDIWDKAFQITNIVFTSLYTIELVIKVLGLRNYYFKSVWNWIDMIVLLISWADVGLKYSKLSEEKTMKVVFQVLKIARIIRIIKLPRHIYPKIKLLIEKATNSQLFLGYDIGKGFIQSIDDVLKILPQMSDNPGVYQRLKQALEEQRLEAIRGMGILEMEYPGIALAVKTRHASGAILSKMRDSLVELKEDGLVDEKEHELLTEMIEHNMKRLWTSPKSIAPSEPQGLLQNVPWLVGNEEILSYMREHAEIVNFNSGEKLMLPGDEPDGIYLIVSGMVKVHYHPNFQITQDVKKLGKLPNTELFLDLTFSSELDDFFSTGTCIGEIGALTGTKRSATVSCETYVMAYHMTQETMKTAFSLFGGLQVSLENRIWRAIGINIATYLLPTCAFYHNWKLDQVRMHLERSGVPDSDPALDWSIPEFVSDVVLLQGRVKNFHKKEVYTAPMLLPRDCVRIVNVEEDKESTVPVKYLVVAHEDIEEDAVTPSEVELHDYINKASALHSAEMGDSSEAEMRMPSPGNVGNRIARDYQNTRYRRRYSIAPFPIDRTEIELPRFHVSPRYHHTRTAHTVRHAHTAHHIT